jgi:TetR/AcrR family transcriptional regulator
MKELDLSTEEKIIEAARQVFVKNGLEGARMQDIADLAGVNKALLHYYFRSKDILFGKVFDHYTNYLIPDLQNIVNLEVPILDKIELFIDKYIGFFQKNTDLPFFFISELNRNPQKIIAILANTNKFQYVQQFAFQMMLAMQEGKIKMINPRHLMLNVISMSLFPFIGRPMIQVVMQIDDDGFTVLLEERKKEISNFIRMALAV